MAGFFSLATGHIISYGTLFGTTFFHVRQSRRLKVETVELTPLETFVSSVVAYQNLTGPQFGALMAKTFPIYFSIQTALPAALALTFPASASAPAGFKGLLEDSNRWSGLLPIATMFLSSVVNLVVIGPATTKVMYDRRLQGKLCGGFCLRDAAVLTADQRGRTARRATTHRLTRRRCRR